MKCVFSFLLCAMALVPLACPALASDAPLDEAASPPPVSVETTEGEKDITVNVTVVNEAASVSSDSIPDESPDVSAPAEPLPTEAPSNDGIVLKTADDTAPMGRSPLLDSVSALLGEYQPRTCTVSTYLPDGTVVETTELVPGLAGLDYTWLGGFALFALSLYCIFRMIGGLLKWT